MSVAFVTVDCPLAHEVGGDPAELVARRRPPTMALRRG